MTAKRAFCDTFPLLNWFVLVPMDAVLFAGAAAASGGVRAGLSAVALFRVGVVVNALLNEWGHVLVALCRGAGRRAANASNLRGNRPFAAHLVALVPFAPDFRGDLEVRIRGLKAAET